MMWKGWGDISRCMDDCETTEEASPVEPEWG